MSFFNSYSFFNLKRKVEELIMYPFIRIGIQKAKKDTKEKNFDIYFFFPIYGLGGAENVNAQIVSCFPEKRIAIFFTRISKSDVSLKIFQHPNVEIFDISKYTDNKLKYWDNLIYRGICSHYINNQVEPPIVFNGQCNFAYKLVPHLRADIKNFELCHNSNRHFLYIILPYLSFIHKRVMIADKIKQEHLNFYQEMGVPAKCYNDMVRINYMVKQIDVKEIPKTVGNKLKVYYAGRGGHQKRLWILFNIIRKLIINNAPVEFHLAGDFETEIPKDLRGSVTYHGVIVGNSAMMDFHRGMDVLLMTSAYEGFPLVIMESMLCGVVPVVPAIDGIPEHITSFKNGLLINNADDEISMVSQGVELIETLINKPELINTMSKEAKNYAMQHFSPELFRTSYRNLLLN